MYGRVGFISGGGGGCAKGVWGGLILWIFVVNRGDFGGCCMNGIFLF